MTLIPANLRAAVVQRAKDMCEFCRLSQKSQVATFPVDHVIPIALGGRTDFNNLALTCPMCNARKWVHIEGIDPRSGERVPLFNPRTQAWGDHFRWSETDQTLMESLTACARATVALLDLNSEHRSDIRRWLMVVEMHPPD